jgi:hypothetical protein
VARATHLVHDQIQSDVTCPLCQQVFVLATKHPLLLRTNQLPRDLCSPLCNRTSIHNFLKLSFLSLCVCVCVCVIIDAVWIGNHIYCTLPLVINYANVTWLYASNFTVTTAYKNQPLRGSRLQWVPTMFPTSATSFYLTLHSCTAPARTTKKTSDSSIITSPVVWEEMCPQSCCLATAIVLLPVNTGRTWRRVYMLQYCILVMHVKSKLKLSP